MKSSDPIALKYLAIGPAYIVVATVAVHIVGSTVLGVATGGAGGILSAPILAIFGCFVLPIELFAVALQWFLYFAFRFSKPAFRCLFVISAVLVPALAAVFGPKEENSELQWAIGFGVGAALSGIVTLLALRLIVKTLSRYVEKQGSATST